MVGLKVEFQLMSFLQAHETLRTVVLEALNGPAKKDQQVAVQSIDEMASVLSAAGGSFFG